MPGPDDWMLGAAGEAMEFGLNQFTIQQQYEQEQNLLDIQMQNQMQLNQQGHDLQMQMWENTNFPAQVEMMEAAGLNPALMYSKAGS